MESKDPIKSCLAGHSPSCKTITNIRMDKRLIDMEKNISRNKMSKFSYHTHGFTYFKDYKVDLLFVLLLKRVSASLTPMPLLDRLHR